MSSICGGMYGDFASTTGDKSAQGLLYGPYMFSVTPYYAYEGRNTLNMPSLAIILRDYLVVLSE